MMRSLFSGVSGLKNHQVRMDVIGNNIANVNTVGYKSSRVTFKEGFAQMLRSADLPNEGRGGVNAQQVGLGMQVGSIDQLFTQGNLESTGLTTDLAIQGDALFVLRNGTDRFYARAGNFQLDADGRMVASPNGAIVQGRMATDGVLQEGITDIQLPFGQKMKAQATTETTLAGNLDASAPIFTGAFDDAGRADPANAKSFTSTTISVYDSLGTKHDFKLYMYKTATAPDTWTWEFDPSGLVNVPDGADGDTLPDFTGGPGTFQFNPDGTLNVGASVLPTISFTPAGADPVTINVDPGTGTINGLTQFASPNNAVLRDQDGYTMGELESFTIDSAGVITGSFSNMTTATLGQIALADFNNPTGLTRVGDGMYSASANSGQASVSFALEGSRSRISSGALEMSNVDLAQEFTNMIVTQRGFQANGRVITSSDEMLQEVVNLKR